jgi:hypothetical protein
MRLACGVLLLIASPAMAEQVVDTFDDGTKSQRMDLDQRSRHQRR